MWQILRESYRQPVAATSAFYGLSAAQARDITDKVVVVVDP